MRSKRRIGMAVTLLATLAMLSVPLSEAQARRGWRSGRFYRPTYTNRYYRGPRGYRSAYPGYRYGRGGYPYGYGRYGGGVYIGGPRIGIGVGW